MKEQIFGAKKNYIAGQVANVLICHLCRVNEALWVIRILYYQTSICKVPRFHMPMQILYKMTPYLEGSS